MKQHSALTSIALHLLPGIPIIAGMFLFARPAFTDFFGLNENLGPLLGFLMSVAFFLIPVQLGILLIASKIETGNFNIRCVMRFAAACIGLKRTNKYGFQYIVTDSIL